MKKLIITLAILCSAVTIAVGQSYGVRPENSELRLGMGMADNNLLSYNLEYSYKLDYQLEVGAFGSLKSSNHSYYNDLYYVSSATSYWFLGLFLRYNWIAKENFSLYSSGSLYLDGVIGQYEGTIYDSNNLPNFGLVLAGVTVGDKVFGFAELGISLHSVVKLGVGCRF